MFTKIKAICQTKKILLKDLEKRAGLAYNTVNRWDRISPSVDKVAAVADVLGVTVDELIGRSAPGLSEGERTLLERFRQLNDEGQANALIMLDVLTRQPAYIKSDRAGEVEAVKHA